MFQVEGETDGRSDRKERGETTRTSPHCAEQMLRSTKHNTTINKKLTLKARTRDKRYFCWQLM